MSQITIKGARVHNLKNINVSIPRDKLVVITGLSGSGKSSLAFDTIYAEGQRRYVESLSSYARQFLGVMDKPDVDRIDGLSPAISIDQRTASQNPRSTVGTVTEIYDYLRLLYARVGVVHCPKCGQEVSRQTTEQIVSKIMSLPERTRIMVMSPMVRDQKGEHKGVLEEAAKAGYPGARVDGALYEMGEAASARLDKNKKHNIEIVVDRLMIMGDKKDDYEKTRLTKAVEAALDMGNGLILAEVTEEGWSAKNNKVKKGDIFIFSQHFSCPQCNIDLPEIEPRGFSFNSPHGACARCGGLGIKLEVDPKLVLPNPRLTLDQGAIRPWSKTVSNQAWYQKILKAVADKHCFSVDTPVGELSQKQIEIVLCGTGEEKYILGTTYSTFEGVIPNLEKRYKETDSDYIRQEIEKYMRVLKCPECDGKRLKKESLAVTFAGRNIAYVVNLTIENALKFFESLLNDKSVGGKKNVGTGEEMADFVGASCARPCQPHTSRAQGERSSPLLTEKEHKIADQILKEIISRLNFLLNVGLNYLTLDRSSVTLSGGEAQRIRLATQIGSALTGVIYILDEPSIGLHQRDNAKLINTLKDLRDLNNTVIVVEHDEAIMRESDYLIDIGPGAGDHGGEIVSQGKPEKVMKDKNSLTGKYLSHKLKIPSPIKYRRGNGKKIKISGAKEFNLKNITVDIPLGKLVCVTGVSGSGKSTLITEILAKYLAKKFYRAKDEPGAHKSITGVDNIDKVIDIDQSPIGRTPRSNPATYTGAFTSIRELFSELPEAKIRGYDPGRFSFNVVGGRCEACAGDGLVKIEMQFLPDVYVECEECRGKRYNQEALEIHYKEKTISDVLNMTVEEAIVFFNNIPQIYEKLKILFDVGLGYVKLGQSATTLSGGEAQRVKLATELSRRATTRTLYILDEPTTGLHFDDVKRLLEVLNKLVDKGNTVLIIEHNLDVIKSADWIIDLGPEGGDKGGEVVAKGTPKDVAKAVKSYTGQYLKKLKV